MTDNLKERLLGLCNGHPNATIPWPHRVIHDALSYITDLEARLAAAEAKLKEWQSSQSYRYIGRDGKPVLARDLEARAEAAEAGEDALAEGARIGLDSFKDHPFVLNDKEQATVERITAALAAAEKEAGSG